MASFDQLPAIRDIEMIQGDDYTFTVQFMAGSPLVAVDLTGYTFDAHIKTAAANVPLTVYVATPSTGLAAVTITAAQSVVLRGNYVWELDWIDPTGKRRSMITGVAKVSTNG